MSLWQKLFGKKKKKDQRFGALYNRETLKKWSKEDLIETVIECVMDHENHNWFPQYYIQKRERERLENVLRSDYHTDKELNHAKHMADLEVKVKRLKKEVTWMRKALEDRNRQLAATNIITYCSGGCDGGIPDKEKMTQEIVDEVRRTANRLENWWGNYSSKNTCY